ncbi:MAG: lipid-A-disaccharide synthase N-terminal domain-containing protein [Candidatus Delongbacteria bacterium]
MDLLHAIGWLGQGAYFVRSLLQWLMSEKLRRSTIPAGFWLLSVLGALALLSYAALRHDAVIILGQAVNLAIYLRNLHLESRPQAALSTSSLRLALGGLALSFLLLCLLSLKLDHSPWMLVGWAGQLIFLTRFPLQWWRAERSGKVDLPATFWWISLLGSTLLLLYATWRHDWVIVSGQAVGLLAYGRNLVLLHRSHVEVVETGSARL